MIKTGIDQVNVDIFEYFGRLDSQFFFMADMEAGECRWSKNAADYLQPPPVSEGMIQWKEIVHPADFEGFMDACQDIRRRHTRSFSGEYRFKLQSGEYGWFSCSGSMVLTPLGDRAMLSGVLTRVRIKNNFDPVTNLRYISNFRSTLSEIAKQPLPYGILIIGIDDFKRINDLYSYAFGDSILAAFARRLESELPLQIQMFRLDGDSFGFLCPNMDVTVMLELFDKIQSVAMRPINLSDTKVSFTVSGGICRYPEDGFDADTLYRNGRIAFTEAKQEGKKHVTVCTQALCARVHRRMRLLEKLRESVQNGCDGFSLRFQPLIHTMGEELYGCEVLLRWRHEEFPEGVSPYEFVPLLEGSGMILEVNKWLMREAFAQCARWVHRMPSFQMNINISSKQFEAMDFGSVIMEILSQTGVPASAITLELTESGEVRDIGIINTVFNFLHSQGFKIALDDFGTGYSSLSIFQMLKADELKIDRSFLQKLTYNVTDQALVRQIIELCHSMNMMVCVEGVESIQVAQILRNFGPELLQGFYYGQPLTVEAFEQCYFSGGSGTAIAAGEAAKQRPEHDQSMVYAPHRHVTPMTMDMVVNNAYAGIFQVSLDAVFSYLSCNEGYRRMLGYTARDIEIKFGNSALGAVYGEDVEYVDREIRRQLGEGDTVTLEFRVVRSDGTPIWILGSGNVVKSPDGSSSLVVVIVENNRLKLDQLETERKYKRYQRILTNLPVGVKCVQNNEDFTLDYMSPAFLSLLGFEEKDLRTMFDGKYINMVLEEDRSAVVSDVLEQIKSGNIVTLRYRSLRKDGQPIWVETISRLYPPEEDGIQRWYSSVVNITDSITEEQKSHARDFAARIQIASDQWGDVLFEFDFISNQVSFSDNYESLFGREPKKDILAESLSIFPEDRFLLLEALKKLHCGERAEPIEVRYHSETRGYLWVRILFGEPSILGGDSVSVIGRMSDIDEEIEMREALLVKSRLDGLTGLLNKKSIEEEIRGCMETSQASYALCVLDIDDFKGINDKLGHIAGDQVLAQTSRRLQEISSGEILLGRAGGDEFMVYARLGEEFPDADSLGRKIIDTLCRPMESDGISFSVYTSVGIACYPQDSTDFYNLFRLADSALYLVKAQGKGSYHVTSPATV